MKGAVWTVDEIEFHRRRPQKAAGTGYVRSHPGWFSDWTTSLISRPFLTFKPHLISTHNIYCKQVLSPPAPQTKLDLACSNKQMGAFENKVIFPTTLITQKHSCQQVFENATLLCYSACHVLSRWLRHLTCVYLMKLTDLEAECLFRQMVIVP